MLHLITKKGKGYAPAEKQQTIWHAPGIFDPETGERIACGNGVSRYQDVFGETLLDLASRNPEIVGVTPAMASGCGMNLLAERMPERFFDVGIAEEHAVTFSAGLAAGGLRPFCNIYSSFSQRAYDQIIHDVALQNLPVVICLDRAGLVGEDGATHHGCYDMAAYRCVPHAVIAVPSDELELRNMMYTASMSSGGPFIIRYPRGAGENVGWKDAGYETLEPGRGKRLVKGQGIAVIAAGPSVYRAAEAAERFSSEHGYSPSVYNIRYIKPLDTELLREACTSHGIVLTVEDGCVTGGLHGAVSEFVAEHGLGTEVVGIGIPDEFISQAGQAEQREDCRMSAAGILGVLENLSEKG